jgi:zinc D-Ala-D-Ala carboxypeptidase
MTQLTANFSLEELTFTTHRNIPNVCPKELLPELMNTAIMLEKIRDMLSRAKGSPVAIHVNSGYRSAALNTAIGGAQKSDHSIARAADFVAPSFGTPKDVARVIVTRMKELGIGQLIYEGTWCHVSTRTPDKAINSVLTARFTSTGVEYSPGIN